MTLTAKYYLGVEIGSKHTRAWLFDDEDGSYRLRDSVAVDNGLITGGKLIEVIWTAIHELQVKTDVALLDNGNGGLAFGSGANGLKGVGLVVSAGTPIKTVLVGVSETYSLAAIRRLTALFNCEIVLTIHQQDELNATAQLSRMIASNADLFVVAGGSNQGATKPVQAALDNIRIVYENMPRLVKPQVVYAGNEAYTADAQAAFEGSPDAHIAGNIQPEIGVEDQTVAWGAMLEAWRRVKRSQLVGLVEVENLLKTEAQPSMFAAGRVLRLLDQMNPNGKGVLALDMGQSEVRIVSVRKALLSGMASRTEKDLSLVKAAYRYLSQPLDMTLLETYYMNKALLPGMVPTTIDELAIEQAIARVRISRALAEAQSIFPAFGYEVQSGLTEPYEPIILSGELFCGTTKMNQALLLAMDGIQPHGITTVVIDQYQVTSVLGALGTVEPKLVVQVIDSGIYRSLCTLVNVNSPERAGRKVLDLEVEENQPERRRLTVLKGDLKRVETFGVERTQVYLSPVSSSEVGMGLRGLGGWLGAADSEIGVVIDARGRPVEMEKDPDTRADQIENWAWELLE